MPIPEGVVRKLQRATEHVAALREAEDRFRESGPYSIDHEVSDDEERHTFRPRVHEPTPAELPLIAGDALTNARAALDYLICGAADRLGAATDANARKWDLPIVDTAPQFIQRTGLIRGTLGEQLVDVLRSMQRFALGTGRQRDERALYLYTLRDLSNIDEHREMSVFGFGTLHMQWHLPAGVTVRNEAVVMRPVEDGDLLADLVLSSPYRPPASTWSWASAECRHRTTTQRRAQRTHIGM